MRACVRARVRACACVRVLKTPMWPKRKEIEVDQGCGSEADVEYSVTVSTA